MIARIMSDDGEFKVTVNDDMIATVAEGTGDEVAKFIDSIGCHLAPRPRTLTITIEP